jgi:hypothetical protein
MPSDRYVILGERGLTSTEITGEYLRPLPGYSARDEQPVTLKLDFTIERNKVVTTVYAIPPDSDPLRYSDGHKHWLGTHSARLNETVDLQELKQVGYLPFALKIVSARPAAPTHPTIISKVPSIQVDLAAEDLRRYTLSLRNTSSRAVVAYAFDDSRNSMSISRTTFNFHGQPVIAPGAAKRDYEFAVGQIPGRIVLAAAVFSDGSHEGEASLAAQLKSGQIGYRTQYRRMEPAIDRIIHDPSLDDDGRVARIRENLHDLSNQPDAATIRAMQSQFPDLSNEAVVADLTEGLNAARRNIWGQVYGYVHSSGTWPPPNRPPPLADWWLRTRQAMDHP